MTQCQTSRQAEDIDDKKSDFYLHGCYTCHTIRSMGNVGLINHTLQRTHAGTQDVSKTIG